MEAARVAAVILAAGAGRRFRAAQPGVSSKLLAELGGQPVLQHVLDFVDGLSMAGTVVIVGDQAVAFDAGLRWRDEQRVRNPDPERGLSSSVQLGLEAVARVEPKPEASIIFLGDQPDVSRDVVDRLLDAADSAPDRPLVAPTYADDRALNPVLVRRAGWPLAGELLGDRGFGPLIASKPELVLRVPVPGAIHDIDTPADLSRMQAAFNPDRA